MEPYELVVCILYSTNGKSIKTWCTHLNIFWEMTTLQMSKQKKILKIVKLHHSLFDEGAIMKTYIKVLPRFRRAKISNDSNS